MRVIALKTLKQFWEKHPDASTGLAHWYDRICNSKYAMPAEVIADFKGADYVGNTRIVFNITRNKYRLIAAFRYDKQLCWIIFIGTHAEYDAVDAATVDYSDD